MAFKHSTMTLYCDKVSIASHSTRIAIAEKDITAHIIYVDEADLPKSLVELNPYRSIPTLVDRDLVLYETNIITEYLDERFPHPPLLPVYPVARAKCRLIIHRIKEDWLKLLNRIVRETNQEKINKFRHELAEQILTVAPLFAEAPYFLSEEFTLADCYLAPMFWRLKSLGIILPSTLKSLQEYMQRIFSRKAFRESLTDRELELGE